jgi:Tol biopolymer transport system component
LETWLAGSHRHAVLEKVRAMRSTLSFLMAIPAILWSALATAQPITLDLFPDNKTDISGPLTWSPDGSKIAFAFQTVDPDGSCQSAVYTISPSGLGARPITRTVSCPGEAFESPAWSPLGDVIALVHSVGGIKHVSIVGASGLGEMFLTDTSFTVTGQLSWSAVPDEKNPDARDLLALIGKPVGTEASNIFTVSRTGKLRQVTTFDTDGLGSVSWSPEGSKILYDFAPNNGNSRVFEINPDGSRATAIMPMTVSSGGPAWSSDGTRVVASCGSGPPRGCIAPCPGGVGPDLCLANRDGGGFRMLNMAGTFLSGDPNFALYTDQVVFSRLDAAFGIGSRIFLVNSNGTELRALSAGQADTGPQWSPDGSQIAYICSRSQRRPPRQDVCIITFRQKPPRCGPDNCSGCCNTSGVCVGGKTAGACGSGGLQCAACPGRELCDPIAAVCAPPKTCGPENCNGCCDRNGMCQLGRVNAACGFGGNACEVCSGSARCDATTLRCSLPQQCGPITVTGAAIGTEYASSAESMQPVGLAEILARSVRAARDATQPPCGVHSRSYAAPTTATGVAIAPAFVNVELQAARADSVGSAARSVVRG